MSEASPTEVKGFTCEVFLDAFGRSSARLRTLGPSNWIETGDRKWDCFASARDELRTQKDLSGYPRRPSVSCRRCLGPNPIKGFGIGVNGSVHWLAYVGSLNGGIRSWQCVTLPWTCRSPYRVTNPRTVRALATERMGWVERFFRKTMHAASLRLSVSITEQVEPYSWFLNIKK